MSRKLSFESVKRLIEESGDVLISKNYISNSTLMEIKCGNCHIVYLQTIKRYKEGRRHMPCGERGKSSRKRPVTYIEKICPVCKIPFKIPKARKYSLTCSKECLKGHYIKKNKEGYFSLIGSKGGKISASIQVRRSKNEIEFANYCKRVFNVVLTNEPIFEGWDADIILPEFKIAILWNGIWHYKKVRKDHDLSQVQRRDKIKHKIIKKHGYDVYIIKDMGKEHKTFVKTEFEYFLQYISEL